ncbi:hypothetical protein JQ600_35670 [Bradyrhizobium sp. AUGA SZCCT0176]|uniref:hypothetical protein n=1 Tax=Bradyrhizobium sp. AUGA SZCCT0176 TaxID=2807664 RepID=UPI001BA5F619|nr:hypothetical protein [Bradyrhizobium sp. AUGA SZCCT0176]MBR1230237.1 hypothetical protein [Bradyrhizobium sp. AUGA SZCCT0176]
MNKHVATAEVVPFRRPLEAVPRAEIVSTMAMHLVAAILHDDLDVTNDIDVIQTLLNTPERFQSRVVLNHMDDAKAEAEQTIIAKEMGDI